MIDPKLIERIKSWFDSPRGQCYVASEALYYLAGGKAAGLKPMQGRHDGVSHWWLVDAEGVVYDLTAEQFDFDWPYHLGTGRGFQANMKNDTKELIAWLTSTG